MSMGEKLYELRKSKNMSQIDVANKIGVSRQSISKWELGESVPEIDKLVLLSDLFRYQRIIC